jgi:hypothetical protein
MNARPPDGRDEPEAVDRVMLAVLSNRGREAEVLSAEQERLLDDWVAGRLPPDAAERAEALAKQNALAAERVLERRLVMAAEQGPAVPEGLASRVLHSERRREASTPRTAWRLFGRWHWASVAGAVALAAIVAVVGVPILQQAMRGEAPMQVAMVTISDRNPLFESSDIRMRGPGAPQAPPTDQRFRDVEIPESVLKSLLSAAAAPSTAATRGIERYLPSPADTAGQPVHLVVDAALREKVDAGQPGDQVPVRVYDLRDPRAADIRAVVGALPDGGRAYLLTVKP